MREKQFKMIIGSHFFKIIKMTDRIRTLCFKFMNQYGQKEFVNSKGKSILKVTKYYACRTSDTNEFRFHIGQLKPFLNLLSDELINENMYDVEEIGLYMPDKVKLSIKDGWTLRDYQEDCRDFILKDDKDALLSKLVSLPTGTGKTFTALYTLASLQQKTVICVLPTYMDKWASDITNIVNVKPKDIMLIRGSDQLKGLMTAAKHHKLPQKYFIISLRTYMNYIKAYEEHNGNIEELGYDLKPDELFEALRVGNLLIDEAHQHLHAVYRLITYSNIPLVVGLTATLLSDDKFIVNMQHIIFPKEKRYDKVKMKKYIKAYAIAYRFRNFRKSKVRVSEWKSKNYSHNAFERSILKNSNLTKKYMDIIYSIADVGYIKPFESGDKLIIFAASKKMCEVIVNYFKKKHPELDIRKYTEEDPYENAIEPDIRVTTIQSCGTAIDIPNLRCTILTNSISSSGSNLQVLGRLRELKNKDVKFFYMYCEDIKKQYQYHIKKMELIRDRVLFIKQLRCPYFLD